MTILRVSPGQSGSGGVTYSNDRASVPHQIEDVICHLLQSRLKKYLCPKRDLALD